MSKSRSSTGATGQGRSTKMTGTAAARIQSSAARNADGASARTGFASRAQSAGAQHTNTGRAGNR